MPLLSARFAALLVANVGFGYAFSCFFLLPKFMHSALGAGPAAVGWVTLLHGATVVVALPLLGAAVDRRGRCRILTAGALVMTAGSLGYLWVDAVGPLLFLLRAVQAVGFSMVFAAGGALAVDLAPPERLGQAIGLYGLSFLVMNAVAPASAELVAARVGWPAAFATAAGGALLCGLLSLRIAEPERAHDPDGNGTGLIAVATRPSTLRCMVVVSAVGVGLISVFAFYQLYAAQLGIESVGALFTAYAATAVVVRGGFGHWMDRIGNHRAALIALAAYVPAVLATIWLDRLGLAVVGIGLGLSHGVFYPAFNAVAVTTARPNERGKLMALHQAAFQVGMASGGLLGLLAAVAGYPAVFVAAAGGLALAFLLLASSPEGRGRAALDTRSVSRSARRAGSR
ncbi:MAG: MFS transporter [Myxococcota bacterium]|nr:MFS transporter [Myxococcota bacterium]